MISASASHIDTLSIDTQSKHIMNLIHMISLFVLMNSFWVTRSLAQESPVKKAIELDLKAKEAYQAGDLTKAVELYQEALLLIEHPDLMIRLAHIQIELEDYKAAKSICQKAIQSPLMTPESKSLAVKCVDDASTKLSEIRAFIETNPTGALLRLDGKSLGRTPWRGQLAPGRRQFDFELENHKSSSRTVNAVEGSRVKLKVRLIPIGLGGLFSLHSVPEGANIILDGSFIGKTPITAFPASSGPHTLQLILAGHLTENRQIYLGEGQNAEINVYLHPKRGRVSAKDLWPAWGLMSAGVLTSILGGVFGYQALSARDRADLLAKSDGTETGRIEYLQSYRDMENFRFISDVLWITSGVLLTGGTTWWAVSQ